MLLKNTSRYSHRIRYAMLGLDGNCLTVLHPYEPIGQMEITIVTQIAVIPSCEPIDATASSASPRNDAQG
ncbi:MAG: hypothetical protein L0H75_11655 [Nitrosospira sp.]|nr:hypothetical protein [Nitrosospira sp.]